MYILPLRHRFRRIYRFFKPGNVFNLLRYPIPETFHRLEILGSLPPALYQGWWTDIVNHYKLNALELHFETSNLIREFWLEAIRRYQPKEYKLYREWLIEDVLDYKE
jgi:hypothetical protein